MLVPPAGIRRLALHLHLQGHRGQFIAAITEPVAVVALQHQEAAFADLNPQARLGHLPQLLDLQMLQQPAAAGLEQLDAQGAQGVTSAAISGLRLEKPQRNRAATSSINTHSGITNWGSARRSSSRSPTRPTAR